MSPTVSDKLQQFLQTSTSISENLQGFQRILRDICKTGFGECLPYIQKIQDLDVPGINLRWAYNKKDVKRTFRECVKELSKTYHDRSHDTLLIHSDIKGDEKDLDSLYDSILDMSDHIEELSENTIAHRSVSKVAFNSILRFKGLEGENIILILPDKPLKSSWDNFLFEVYEGITRAIMNIYIIVYKV